MMLTNVNKRIQFHMRGGEALESIGILKILSTNKLRLGITVEQSLKVVNVWFRGCMIIFEM